MPGRGGWAAAVGLAALAGAAGAAGAQAGAAPVRRWEVGAGTDGTTALVALAAHRLWPVAAAGRVRIGAGGRWTSWVGGSRAFAAANGAADSLTVPIGWLSAVNLAGHVAVQATDRLAFGANLDLAGLSLGTTQVGTLRTSGSDVRPRVTASPVLWNLSRGGAQDRGTLSSEAWVGWDARRDLRVRLGLNRFVLEQTTPTPGTAGNTRYRRIGHAVFVSLGRLMR